MIQWKSAEEILNFAIQSEQDAIDLYTKIGAKANTPYMRSAFKIFVDEEKGHKAKLEAVKRSGVELEKIGGKTLELEIGDYFVKIDPDGDLDYQGALLLAMKKEKASFRLYTDMAESTADPLLRELLLRLAQEEAKHKLRFELEYDEMILVEK